MEYILKICNGVFFLRIYYLFCNGVYTTFSRWSIYIILAIKYIPFGMAYIPLSLDGVYSHFEDEVYYKPIEVYAAPRSIHSL
jgi:hypothetical protein